MRAFACPNCGALIFFENTVCITCGQGLGFERSAAELVVLKADADGRLGYTTDTGRLQQCENLVRAGCNWLTTSDNPLCGCCALTRTRPADTDLAGLATYARTEAAKRRLVFELDWLALQVTTREDDPKHGLAFDLLSSADGPVITGHDSGIITIDLAEGDDPHREALRVSLAEPYRTLLGHLRHEVGHWYWDVLVEGSGWIERFRALFGDERADYSEALTRHYGKPDTGGWFNTHVSHYAAAHPWEDWAETFAHYLHIRDTLQTSASFGMAVAGPDLPLRTASPVSAEPAEDPDSFRGLVDTWLPFTIVLNQVNRSMGKDDLYPFVLSPAVLEKLRFVHLLVNR